MKSNILNSFKSCALSAEEIHEASERLSLLGRKVGPYSEAELKARGRGRIKMLHAAIMGKSCYTCRFHLVDNTGSKLGCTFNGLCHTPEGEKLKYRTSDKFLLDVYGPSGDIMENLNLHLL